MTQRGVCVAIPVKNGAAYLAEAIESVLAQDGVDLSVRVIDNGSDDASRAIAERYAAADPRVTTARNPVDVFYYGSLNRALAETDSEFFVPFAADDVMHPGNLERKVEALVASGAGFAHSPARVIDADGAPLDVWPDHRETPALLPAPEFFARLMPRNAVACQSVVARTTALREIGGFDGRSYYAADWLAWMRLSLRAPVVTVHDALIDNRVHAQTGTNTAGAAGLNGRDVPVTLDHAFSDERLPAAYADQRDPMVALAFVDAANTLSRSGILRLAQGWSGYMAMGRALQRRPDDAGLRAQYAAKVTEAGLVAPELPWAGVARAPQDAADAAALGEAVETLEGLLASLTVAVEPDALDGAMALLEPVFGETALPVAVTPGVSDADLLVPGRLTLARWGSELVSASEAAGVPVFPYAFPQPFARRPDPGLWETVDPAGCLA
ncbi:MAG TPA: glycosyltransferase [Baekduia sp.]|uniref:glycosyltransferase family 2 protein n=1 Tax=Baekduia sp. TaxID=2600305 RepID=UPI002B76E94B|nr:glycosyltransferase [Baekduia sp.]HMJ33089.1 glycosyltransferase [Baekduia sp.]